MAVNSKILFRSLADQIHSFDHGEAEEMVYRLLERKLKLTRNDILLGKETKASADDFKQELNRINQHEPIQYILNEEEFYGRSFYVDSSVLIPRPETEELVRYCIDHLVKPKLPLQIIDIGTGSGCIPITLALQIPSAKVTATDISEAALQVAQRNAKTLQANVSFLKHDILNEELPSNDFDLIISNPPYISEEERATMFLNVLDHEPHTALFTGSDDVLIFYKAIAREAKTKLKSGGHVAVEINEHFGKETAALFTDDFFTEVKIIKDINQKDRIVIARRR